MKGLMVISATLLLFANIYYGVESKKEKMEYAYLEGQKDYMAGDIRIMKDGEDYLWIKSPWNSDRATKHEYLSDY